MKRRLSYSGSGVVILRCCSGGKSVSESFGEFDNSCHDPPQQMVPSSPVSELSPPASAPFCRNPVTNVCRTILEHYASGLATSQKPNCCLIDQGYVLQVENQVVICGLLPDHSFQLCQALFLDSTNDAQNHRAVPGRSQNLQHRLSLSSSLRFPCCIQHCNAATIAYRTEIKQLEGIPGLRTIRKFTNFVMHDVSISAGAGSARQF